MPTPQPPTAPLTHAAPPRLRELLEELTPELAARGFTAHAGHPLWARPTEHGLLTAVLSYAPDDDEGGWVEAFAGLVDERVETQVAGLMGRAATHGPFRHTVLAGSTRWPGAKLYRQPVHSPADGLEAANLLLRWWSLALPELAWRFGDAPAPVSGDDDAAARGTDADPAAGLLEEQRSIQRLDALFNAAHPFAPALLTHELYRALRGVTVRAVAAPEGLTEAYDFHRARMQATGFWDVYGEQVRAQLLRLS